jgi:hypothetical protein
MNKGLLIISAVWGCVTLAVCFIRWLEWCVGASAPAIQDRLTVSCAWAITAEVVFLICFWLTREKGGE